MTTILTYIVNSPTSGTEYIMPAGDYVTPQVGTLIEVFAGLYNSSDVQIPNGAVTAIIRNVTTSSDAATHTETFAGSAVAAGGYAPYTFVYNGTDTITGAGKFTQQVPYNLPAYIKIELTYTPSGGGGGGGLTNLKVKRSGAWSTASAIHVKRSGVWVSASAGYVKRSGVWVKFWG